MQMRDKDVMMNIQDNTTTEVIIINNPRSCRLLRVVEKGTVDDDDKGGVISPRLLGC